MGIFLLKTTNLSAILVLMTYVSLLVLTLVLAFWAKPLLVWFFSTLWKILILPWTLFQGIKRFRERHRIQKCRELCAQYFFIIGNSPQTIQYFETLIHQGISLAALKKILEANLVHYQRLEREKQLESLDHTYRNQANIAQFQQEKEDLLTQTRLSLERLQHKEKILGKVVEKLNKKFPTDLSLPPPLEATDE
jgi:hypothetical protein